MAFLLGVACLLGLVAAWQTKKAAKAILAVVIVILAMAAGGFLTYLAPACALAGYATARIAQKVHAFFTKDRENTSVTASLKAFANKHKLITIVACIAAFVLVQKLLGF